MNLRCPECGKRSYTSSPDALIRKGVRCDCGAPLVRVEEDPERRPPDGGEARPGAI